ncbi:MAG: hypothetical protein ACOY46_09280 [Bacillota bacterium]
MGIEEFRNQVTVLLGDKAYELRSKYIKKFVNTELEHYKKYIEVLNEYSDGLCYIGYLWDCLKNPIVIDFQYIGEKVDKLDKVFVLWDIHTKDRIFIENYWMFGKDSVLSLEYKVLLNNLNYLPEDIYIFDKSYDWTLIITHEYVNGKRWCLGVGF